MRTYYRLIAQPSALLREAIGTFILVATGTSVLTAVNIAGQGSTPLIILLGSLAFALPLAWLTFSLSGNSIAQFNPATTLLLFINGRLSISQLISHSLVQLSAAIAASLMVGLVYGAPGVEIRLGAVYPSTSMGIPAALCIEFVGSLLIMASLQQSLHRQASHSTLAINLGLAFIIASFIASGVSGGAFNPVRALAPQLAAGDLTHWWLYIIAPMLAAATVGIIGRQASNQPTIDASPITINEPSIDKSPIIDQPSQTDIDPFTPSPDIFLTLPQDEPQSIDQVPTPAQTSTSPSTPASTSTQTPIPAEPQAPTLDPIETIEDESSSPSSIKPLKPTSISFSPGLAQQVDRHHTHQLPDIDQAEVADQPTIQTPPAIQTTHQPPADPTRVTFIDYDEKP